MSGSDFGEDRYETVRALGVTEGGTVQVVTDRRRGGATLVLRRFESVVGERLERELARRSTLLAARHPNLAQLFDVDVAGDGARVLCEYVEGEEIAAVVRRDGPERFADLAVEAIRGLAFLHDLGWVHGEVRPSKFRVRRRPRLGCRVSLLDWAPRLVDIGPLEDPRRLAYLAPETYDGSEPTPAGDVYALGVTLFESMFGHIPFRMRRGDAASFMETVRAGRRSRPATPPGFPVGLDHWLEQLLDPDPASRPPDAAEALSALNGATGATLDLETPAGRAARLEFGDPPDSGRIRLDLLEHLAPSREPRLVLIVGGPGSIGPRLLESVAAEAGERGWHVETRSCAELDDDLLARLRRTASRGPALLLVNRADEADGAALSFLQRVVREDKAPPLRVAAALRSDRIRHPALRRLLEQAGASPALRRIDLAPLDSEGLLVLAQRCRATPDRKEAARILDTAGGHRSVAAALLILGDAGALSPVRQAVDVRARLLSSAAASWIEALCVLDESATDDRVLRLSGLTVANGFEAANETAAGGLARRRDGRWRIVSAAVADALLQSMEPLPRRTLHRRAVDLLLAESDTPAEIIAQHQLLAGERERALETLTGAADDAGEDTRGAARFLGLALRVLARDDPRRFDLRLRQAKTLAVAHLPRAAARAYGGALARVREPTRRAELLIRQAEMLSRAGRHARARATAERFTDESLLSPASRARRIRVVAADLLHVGARSQALLLLERLAESPPDDPLQQAESLLAVGECRLTGGDDVAREPLQRALRLFEENDRTERAFFTRLALADLERRGGRYAAARDLLEAAAPLAVDPAFRVPWTAALTRIAHLEGRWAEAVAHAHECQDLTTTDDDRQPAEVARRHLALSLARCGRVQEGERLLELAEDHQASTHERLRHDLARIDVRLSDPAAPPAPEREGSIATLQEQARRIGDVAALRWGVILELEHRATLSDPAPVAAVLERVEEVAGLLESWTDPHQTARARLALGRIFLNLDDPREAAEQADAALALARASDLPAVEAAAASLETDALEKDGQSQRAEESRERGARALDRAAARVNDPDLRAGLTERPEFGRLRRPIGLHSAAVNRRLLVLYDVIRELNSENDPELMLETILDSALTAVGAERGLILLREADDEYSVRLARNLEHQTIQDARAFSQRVLRQAASGRAVLALDTESDERLRQLKSVSMFGIHSVLCVPLRSRDTIVGAVYLDSRERGACFSEDDLRFLEAFAGHAALALQNARSRLRLERENRRLRDAAAALAGFGNIVGGSPAMREVFELIRKVQESELPVLIQGESGTGKELVARAVHFNGPRAKRAFVSENCAALPESLLQSELFGHVKGAFTGAERNRQGLFEQAHRGTLFLDEVGDMPPGMQAQLLRVVQDGEVRPVGGDRSLRVDVRVIAATHRDLQREVEAGRFREDLMYRLQVLLIRLPPLREREGDVATLVDHFLDRIAAERSRPRREMDDELLELLERYRWPGNVRQLENALQRLCLLGGPGRLTTDLLEMDPGLSQMLREQHPQPVAALSLERSEREQIVQALRASQGNRTGAARMLGVSRATIYRRIKEYGL